VTARPQKTASQGTGSKKATPARRKGAFEPLKPWLSRPPKARPARTAPDSRIFLDPWAPIGPADDPSVHLIARARLGAVPFIAEAIAVKAQAGGLQSAVEPSVEPRLDELWEAFGIDGPAETVTIDGRDYLVFVAPAG
jgi:hypothetical protein